MAAAWLTAAAATFALAQPGYPDKPIRIPLVDGSPAELAEVVRIEMPMWGKVVRDAGIKAAQ